MNTQRNPSELWQEAQVAAGVILLPVDSLNNFLPYISSLNLRISFHRQELHISLILRSYFELWILLNIDVS